jgi:ankyrin repeat protein
MRTLALLALILALPGLAAAAEPSPADRLSDAIHSGDPVRVKKLLDADPKLISHKDRWGLTPLHAAAARYNPEVVKLLLDAGAGVNEKLGDHEHTPLHRAVGTGSKEVVALLLARGADANAATKSDRFTPLHSAADRGHVAIIALLLAKGASPDGGWKKDSGERPGRTPLHYAVRERHLDAIRLLIAKGATIDAPDVIHDTLLFGAVERDDVEVVKLLLQKGADPNKSSSLLRALSMGQPEMIRLFVEKGADFKTEPRLLEFAAASGKKEVVELVLAKSGIVLTDSENLGMPALFYASQHGLTDMVRFLLGKGVDPNILGKHHTTPLHAAATKEIGELLLKHKAKVDEPDTQGVTPMHAAVRRGNKALAELLEAHGANHTVETLTALGRDGVLKERLQKEPLKKEPPKKGPVRPDLLHLATSFGQFTTARVLIDAGADVNAVGPEGKTPLHLAASFGELATVRALISAGADVNALDRLDGTPLHAAAARGHLALVELLVEHKARVNAKMKELTYHVSPPGHITPLMVALEGGHADVVRVLAKAGGQPAIDGAKNAAALLPAAAKNKHWALVKLLIEQGAPPNTTLPHQEGSAVLHLAAEAGDLKLVKWLLARKADLKSLDVRGWTPLVRAAEAGQIDLAKFLLAHGARADDGSLFRAAAGGHVALVELLLANGADRDAVFDRRGYTALGYAASEGRIEVVKLLHGKGASVKKDVGILHTAAFRGHREVVAFLLDKGADVEQAWPDGYDLYSGGLPRRQSSALAFFAETDPAKLPKWRPFVNLAEFNLGNQSSIIGGRPLQAAVAGRQQAVAQLLLDRGASPKVLFPDGSTLLHLAAELGDAEMAELLLKQGTQADTRNRNGRTALSIAVERADEGIAALLRARGAKE